MSSKSQKHMLNKTSLSKRSTLLESIIQQKWISYIVFQQNSKKVLNQNNCASNQDLNSSIAQKKSDFFTGPYLGKPSTTLFKNLWVLIKSKLDIKITPIFKTTKISSYFNIKSWTPSYLQSNVVYKYACSRGVNVTYVGYSARHLIKERRNISVTANQTKVQSKTTFSIATAA